MTNWILSHEPVLRLGSFVAVFAIMALWEVIAARRELCQSRQKRWIANLGICVLDSLLVRLFFPAAAVGLALLAESEGWGLLNRIDLPVALSVAVSIILLDLTIYLQHVMFHAVPALWRFHMVHHADQDFDLTTGIRFHPIEILLSIVIKSGVIAALGPPPWGHEEARPRQDRRRSHSSAGRNAARTLSAIEPKLASCPSLCRLE